MNYDRHDRAMDRYATGNWGEDSVPDDESCCNINLPQLNGHRQEGECFTCPDCRTTWEWIEDEAEGGFWSELLD